MMYETVNDVLREKGIDPADVLLIRHVPSKKDFRRAYRAGYLKEYTAMQEDGFAEGQSYLMVFIGEKRRDARFYELYKIAGRYPTRKDRIPAGYPNKEELEEPGVCFDLREEPLPPGLHSFVVDWGGNIRQGWKQPATNNKRIKPETIE